jgi:hypothetical protein
LATSSLASAPTIDVKIRLAERDQRQAADSRTEIERYLNDPPPGRHALAQRNRQEKTKMSALPPKADMCGATKDVRFGPKADIALTESVRQKLVF